MGPNKLQKIKNFLFFQGSPFCFSTRFPLLHVQVGKIFTEKVNIGEGTNYKLQKCPDFNIFVFSYWQGFPVKLAAQLRYLRLYITSRYFLRFWT